MISGKQIKLEKEIEATLSKMTKTSPRRTQDFDMLQNLLSSYVKEYQIKYTEKYNSINKWTLDYRK